MKRSSFQRGKILSKTLLCLFLLLTLSQTFSLNITPVHSDASTLQVFAEAPSFGRFDDEDPTGWFYQAILYNPTSSDIVVTGLKWWYNGTAKIVEASRNARCYDTRYFSSAPTTRFIDDRTIGWEYPPGNISITVPPKRIIVTWIEVPTRSVNDETIQTTYSVQAYDGTQWLSSLSYSSHSSSDNSVNTIFRADFDLTTDPNGESQTHPWPQWLYNENRTIVAGIPTKVRLIPIASSRNAPNGITATSTINITLPSNWIYIPGSEYNPYGETITYYSESGKDKLKWDLANNVLRYASNSSMSQNYIELNVTAPNVPDIYNFTITATIKSMAGKTTNENQYIYVVVKTPPKANFTCTPSTTLTGENVTCNAATSYDLDGQIVNYFWDYGDGNNGTGQTSTHAYTDNGTYTVTLTITDNDELTDTVQDIVNIENKPPIARFTETAETVDTNTVIYFNASNSYDPDGYIVDYLWDFGDGAKDIGIFVNHTYAKAGFYTVTLNVTDNDGDSAIAIDVVTILDRPPVVSFTFSPLQPLLGEIVTFNATGSYDLDGTIANYTWSFGDGNTTTTTSSTITHQYSQSGIFNVTLTVNDDGGNSNSTTQTISVNVHNVAITNATLSNTEVQIGETINITVLAKNKGTITETFNVAVLYNETIIASQLVTDLSPDAEQILIFTWNTSSVPSIGKFLIQAKADIVPNENDVTDNVYTAGTVNVVEAQHGGSSILPHLDWNWLLVIVPLLGFLIGGVLWKKRNISEKLRGFDYFNEITNGGIPDSFSVLITGGPGSGKSILCQELCYSFLCGRKSCAYVTYDCFPDEVRDNMEKFHPDVPTYEDKKKFLFIDCYSSIAKVNSKEKYSLTQPFSLSDLGIIISQATGQADKALKVFLDSIVPLLTHVDPLKVVEFLQDRSARIKGVNGTFVFTVGKETIEPSLINRLEEVVDCVIELETNTSKGKTERRLRVKKMRGRKPSDKWIRFEVYPTKGISFLI